MDISPRTDLNGRRVKRPDLAPIYLIDAGFKRLIQDPATFNQLFCDWNDIAEDLDLDAIPDGPPLTLGAALVRTKESPTVYFIDQGMKREVADEAAMTAYHFDPKKVFIVPAILIAGLKTARRISMD